MKIKRDGIALDVARLLYKAVPLQAWSGPEGPSKLRFMTTAQDGGKVVSLTHRPPLFPECEYIKETVQECNIRSSRISQKHFIPFRYISHTH